MEGANSVYYEGQWIELHTSMIHLVLIQTLVSLVTYISWNKDDSRIKIRSVVPLLRFIPGKWSSYSQRSVESLKEAFAQDTEDQERSLITQLHNYNKDTSSVSNFIKRFEGICDDSQHYKNLFYMMIRLASYSLDYVRSI